MTAAGAKAILLKTHSALAPIIIRFIWRVMSRSSEEMQLTEDQLDDKDAGRPREASAKRENHRKLKENIPSLSSSWLMADGKQDHLESLSILRRENGRNFSSFNSNESAIFSSIRLLTQRHFGNASMKINYRIFSSLSPGRGRRTVFYGCTRSHINQAGSV